MNTSLLICGSDRDSRLNLANDIASNFSSKSDVILLDAFETKGIANVREFIAKLNRKPFNSKVLTGIVVEANYLTLEAQAALLKTLEEPNVTTRLILTAASEFSLLSTISSRCQKKYLNGSSAGETNIPEKILSSKFADRLELAEKLDLLNWSAYIRGRLRETIDQPNVSPIILNKFVKYLRFLERINRNRQLANPKLSKYLAVASLPEELKLLASR